MRRFAPSPCPTRAPCLLGLALAACGGAPAAEKAGDWLTPAEDLGAPLLEGGPTAALPGDDRLWFVVAQHLPGLHFDDPAVDLPLSLWEVALQDQVADEGSCPYRDLTDRGERWSSGCRSQDGYQWEGGLESATWSAGGLRWSRTDFDLEITADVDDPTFDHLRIVGAVVFTSPDSADPEGAPQGYGHGTQANVRVELSGFWGQLDPADPREPAWDGWAVVGRTEEVDGISRVEADTALGGEGQLRLRADALHAETACGAVPGGAATLEAADGTAGLAFDPDGACAPCAAVTVDGAERGRSCEG